MKKLLFSLFAIATISVTARGWKQIKGNGNLKKETRQAGTFTALSNSGSMDVVITYGSSSSIEIEADDNLLPYIETKVEGNKLIISGKGNVGLSSKNKITVRVQMVRVEEIGLSGSGDITGNGAFANNEYTQLAISGSGKLSIGFASLKKLEVAISGSGSVTLTNGNGEKLAASISGSGGIDASTVSFQDVEASISGSGKVKVIANKSIYAQIKGSGSVYYSGNATNITTKYSGSGKVVKI